MYFDNDYDLTFDIKKISKATCLSENDTLIAFNSLLTKKLIKLNQIKNEGGKVIDKVSLENFYNNLKETIDLEKEEKNENSIFFKFQEKFGKQVISYSFKTGKQMSILFDVNAVKAPFEQIKAINIPIPAEMANRRFFGIHSNILSRILRKVMARKMMGIPSTCPMAHSSPQ